MWNPIITTNCPYSPWNPFVQYTVPATWGLGLERRTLRGDSLGSCRLVSLGSGLDAKHTCAQGCAAT
jgi:hypothetical protein